MAAGAIRLAFMDAIAPMPFVLLLTAEELFVLLATAKVASPHHVPDPLSGWGDVLLAGTTASAVGPHMVRGATVPALDGLLAASFASAGFGLFGRRYVEAVKAPWGRWCVQRTSRGRRRWGFPWWMEGNLYD